ncbi:MAG: V-type ATP synthase subunit E [Oscillospiraceae bacterium]|nr:V-type ATP synthase subunit E [Oscillospiraceae bacterium]
MQLKQEEKVKKFIDAIASEAEERLAEIQQEVDAYIEIEMEKAKKEIAAESELIFAKQKSKVNQDFNIELSRGLKDKRMQLFKRREEITDEIFNAAAEKIITFKISDNYNAFLTQSVNKAQKICGEDMKIHMMEEDKDLLNIETEIIIDDSISLGGFKFENAAGTVFVDDTLDAKLMSEKEWFKMRSGLIIT